MDTSPSFILSILTKSTLLAGSSVEQIEKIVPFVQVKQCEPGYVIIKENEVSADIYVIVEGSVEIIKEGENDTESHSIAKLRAGDYFGEMAVFEESIRAATVRAIELTTVLVIPAQTLIAPESGRHSLYGAVVTNISTQLSNRLRNTNKLAVAALQRELVLVKKMAEKSLRESREQLRVITDALPVLISYIDVEQNYKFTNKVYEEWFNRPLAEIVNRPVREILGDTAYTNFSKFFQQALYGREVNYEIVIPYKKSQERYVSAVLIPHMVDGEVKGFFSLMNDITPHKRAQERLNYLASHDPLTKLPNRSLFYEKLNNAIAFASHNRKLFAILFLDLDHFKYINDTLGHDVGDKLLTNVVGRLRSCVRSTDTVARMGGDEFTIIVEDLDDYAPIHRVAEKICARLAESFAIDEHTIYITASIGISVYPSDGIDANSLLKNSDMAMYTAKAKGRNNYQFVTTQLTEENSSRLSLENHLASALEHEEFYLEFLPEVNLKTNQPSGIRPLLSWHNSELGILQEVDFMPTAERMNLVHAIHYWVVKSVCNQYRIWHDNKFIQNDVQLIINIPSSSLLQDEYAEFWFKNLKEMNLDPRSIRLEISETNLISAQNYSVNILLSLQKSGMELALSSFGAGYSSMSFIKSIPLKFLNLDQGLTTINLSKDTNGNHFAGGLIGLGHAMGLSVGATQIVTGEQLENLRSIGCDRVEGEYVSPPLNSVKMGAYLKQGPLKPNV